MIVFRDTKNTEHRGVPLVGLALDVMREHAKVQRIDTNLVFPNASGKRPLSIRSAWEVAVKRAGLEDFTFHDLRHSCASYLAMNGATLSAIGAVLGHKSLQMVKRYSHLAEDHTRTVLTRMNSSIFN
jgi:integrase